MNKNFDFKLEGSNLTITFPKTKQQIKLYVVNRGEWLRETLLKQIIIPMNLTESLFKLILDNQE